MRSSRLIGAALLLTAGALGCGLGDYEERIDRQHTRIKLFDEEVKALGDAIALPGKKENNKDVPAWPFDVFLRLPRGTNSAPAGPYTGLGARLPVYLYGKSSTGLNTLVAAGFVAQKNKEGAYKVNEWTPEDFRRELLLGLKDFYSKQYGFFLDIRPSLTFRPERRTPHGPDGEPNSPIPFEAAEITDDTIKEVKGNSVFLIYHYLAGNRQVGIIYQVPKVQRGEEMKRVDFSLKSLDAFNATARRQEFRKL